MSESAPHETEKTFRAYDEGKGQAYAAIRRDYAPGLYEALFAQHASTGGQLDTVLDIGCGPGTSVRQLAERFVHAIGLDPSEGMIAAARALGGESPSGEPIRFELSTAEELGTELSPPVKDGSVDLITAATAAHWFDMDGFWPAAARVLKPGGSVAIWGGHMRVHPSVPNAAAIQAMLEDYEKRDLEPFFTRGNFLTRDNLRDLPLPWTLATPETAFDETTFFRKEWDADELFYSGHMIVGLDDYEKIMGTGSPVTRWREAHPETAGTEQDIVRRMRREIEQLLHDAGVEKGKEYIRGAIEGTLIIVKKKALV